MAQGQGISLLVRAHAANGGTKYLNAAGRAFQSFLAGTDQGGIAFTDAGGNLWFEEYLVSPPTHILNGFIWAAWGVYDYFLVTGSLQAKTLFEQLVKTLLKDETLPRKSLYYVGFHFCERMLAERDFGHEILLKLSEKSNEEGKMAKEKLMLEGFLKSSGKGWLINKWWCPAVPAVFPAGTMPRIDRPKRATKGDSSVAPSFRLVK